MLLREASRGAWLSFDEPIQLIQAGRTEEVLPALHLVEEGVRREGLYAAGFLSYEAAPAFDPAFETRPPGDFPLLWFGLYPRPQTMELPESPPPSHGLPDWTPSIDRDQYGLAIARIKDHIAQGGTYQVNFTLRLDASFAGDARDLFLELVRAQPTEYASFVDTGRYAVCSASPELFFRLDGGRITCRPMKGTASRGLTTAEDRARAAWLAASEKNRAENVMIVDMLRNDLGRVAETGSVEVLSLFDLQRYPSLWQMTSTVTAATRAGLTEILGALFPCASITGAPKIRTMRIIAELETRPRNVYTGCIGFLAPDRTAQFNVAIRTVLVDRQAGTAEYGVGGGIVWDSSAGEEYAECQTKARLLTQRPPDFSLLEAILWTPADGCFLLPYHLQRLSDSAGYFDFAFEPALFQARLDELVAGLPSEPHKLRLALSRAGEITCQAEALSAIPRPDPARLGLAAAPVDSQDVWLYHKTTNRQAYQAARASRPDCDDALLWNERGEATETDSANLVVRLGGRLYTPPVACGLLGGTFRAWLLEQGEVEERVIPVAELEKCDRIYIVNSIRKWREAVMAGGSALQH